MQSTWDSGLRIGELADLAATTPRAIRHYHKLGLLIEPERDESGYRRYGPEHLIRLVRIRRLRSLDMPLEEISGHLDRDSTDGDIGAVLRAWAQEVDEQIERLVSLRTRILDFAASGSLSDPTARWEAALRQRGVLDPSSDLPRSEQAAARLIDALHPQGIQGMIDQSADLVADPAVRQRLGELLVRFQALPEDASDEVVDALAAECASALPKPADAPPAIDIEMMDKLLGDRLSPAKLRCLRRMRELLERRRG